MATTEMANTDPMQLLLIEDNPPDALLLRGMLRAPGSYAVTEAASLGEAKAALARQTFDLVLLDLSLPDSLGLETLDRLNAAAPQTPIVILTGLMDEAVALDAVSHGAQDYLVKGRVDGAQLTRAIRYAIDRKRNETQLHEQAQALAQANERQALLSQTAAHLLAAQDSTAMVRELFNQVCAHLNVHAYFNFMVSDTGDALRLDSCSGIPEEVIRPIQHLDFGMAVCDTVARIRQMIHATAIQQSDDPKVQLLKGYGIRAYCCNPLMAGERLLGTLSFASCAKDRFDDDEVEFMRTICQYVAMATDRLRLEKELRGHVEQLAEADRRKDEFLAMLAHELRNPLAPIRNAVQILDLAGANEPVRKKNRQIIDRQVKHMARLLDDLLDVSRVTRGKIALKLEFLDLRTVVLQAVEMASPAAKARRLELHYANPERPVWLEGDFTRLEQVVGNLINNAIKYSDEGQIKVTVERESARGGEGPLAVVRVRDTGIGISPEMLPRIFELFAQADQSLERTRGGLGIGLTMVRRLVGLHGGRAEARSAGLGQGSEFSIFLPLRENQRREETPGLQESAPNGQEEVPLKVLVVDDNHDAAGSLKDLLELWGYEARTAYDGPEGVQLAFTFVPDVVLLDIGLPGMSGYAVARKLRETRALETVKIIALTGYGQEEDRKMTSESGCDAHLVKPVDLHDLQTMLARIMIGS